MEPWSQRLVSKIVDPRKAAARVKNGDRVFLGSMCAEPKSVIQALASCPVDDVELIQFMPGLKAEELVKNGHSRFRLKTFSMAGRTGNSKKPMEADYLPLYHSEIPTFFRNRRIPVDVAIVQVAPPDQFGRFSLGTSVDISSSAVESARTVIAQLNPRMPRTHGDTLVEFDRIDYVVEAEEELGELPEEILGDREKAISEYCSELIQDGSILQFGFAGISRGLIEHLNLRQRKNLGIHTEIMTDPVIELIETGIVNNSTKSLYKGKSLATCCMGTRRLYDFVNDNDMVELYPSEILLNHAFIASNDRMVAINLALQVDLRGQIRQGSPTWTAFEGSGGDHDFMRGATLSRGGRSIVCLRSTSLRSGRSTIVPSFGPRSANMMNRGEVNYIITEYGTAYLGGKSVRDRALALIEIAHPDYREELMKQAREMGYVYPDQVYVRTASPELRQRVRTDHVFKGNVEAHIRVIKPTDESMIRDLFYNLSEGSVYFRYFSPKRSMPHDNLQKYVNLSEEEGLSLVVTIGPRENRRIIAEARYVKEPGERFYDTAFMVDENYQGKGIATFLLKYLVEIAKERGVAGFKADVLVSNRSMLKVYESVPYVLHKQIADGVISLSFSFDEPKDAVETKSA
jgi:acyl-CoA hydrolase/GNAT superfamily N-acetyltransferase